MKKSSNKLISRRKFLNDCGKMSSIGVMSSILSLKMMNKVMAAKSSDDLDSYKGLVCVFLKGGNDSFNMLAPGAGDYSIYESTRGSLAIPINEMHQIQSGSNDFNVHRSMAGIRDLYAGGDLSFIANVGTLVQPTTLSEYQNGAAAPFGLFSHVDQQRQWQTSVSDSRSSPLSGSGWGGRMLEVLNDTVNNNATASVSLAPGGSNLFQTGNNISPVDISNGVASFSVYESNASIRDAFGASLESTYSTVLQNHHEYVRKETVEQNALLQQLESQASISSTFPNTSIGRQLQQVAEFISIQGPGGFDANRQTFYVEQGGYDLHGEGLESHNGLLQELSDALVAFNQALKDIGYHDKVVTYTASDFGRSLTSNGSGTDHGWGGNTMVMGGPVSGGQVFGDYPTLALNSLTDTGRGRQLPTTSVDELNASLACWFGVSNDSEMEVVVPNIRNFWSSGSNDVPVQGLFG